MQGILNGGFNHQEGGVITKTVSISGAAPMIATESYANVQGAFTISVNKDTDQITITNINSAVVAHYFPGGDHLTSTGGISFS